MKHYGKIGVVVVLLTLCATFWVVSASSAVDQKAVLSGRVLPMGLVASGTIVREGSPLLFVDSITGAVPAARATTDGTIREVLVKPGDMVKTGDVVVRIEPPLR